MRVTVLGQDESHEVEEIHNIRPSSGHVDVLIPEMSDDAEVLQNMPLDEAVVTCDGETYSGQISKWEIGLGNFAFRVTV